MLNETEKQQITQLVHHWVVPAIGCTEPICVALAASKAAEVLCGVPDRIEANILMNGMCLCIPGSGLVWLPRAIARCVLVGKSEYGLEVLRDSTPAMVEQGKAYIDAGRINIALKRDANEKL